MSGLGMLDSLSHMSGFFSLLGYLPQYLMWAVIFPLLFIKSKPMCIFKWFFYHQGSFSPKFIYEKNFKVLSLTFTILPNHTSIPPSFLKIIYLFIGSSLMPALFSRCSKWGLFYSAWASHCGGFFCYGARAPGRTGFSSWGSRAPQLQFPGSRAQTQ